jgi:hypothetical protein
MKDKVLLWGKESKCFIDGGEISGNKTLGILPEVARQQDAYGTDLK